jgi:hypothetical protein
VNQNTSTFQGLSEKQFTAPKNSKNGINTKNEYKWQIMAKSAKNAKRKKKENEVRP